MQHSLTFHNTIPIGREISLPQWDCIESPDQRNINRQITVGQSIKFRSYFTATSTFHILHNKSAEIFIIGLERSNFLWGFGKMIFLKYSQHKVHLLSRFLSGQKSIDIFWKSSREPYSSIYQSTKNESRYRSKKLLIKKHAEHLQIFETSPLFDVKLKSIEMSKKLIQDSKPKR